MGCWLPPPAPGPFPLTGVCPCTTGTVPGAAQRGPAALARCRQCSAHSGCAQDPWRHQHGAKPAVTPPSPRRGDALTQPLLRRRRAKAGRGLPTVSGAGSATSSFLMQGQRGVGCPCPAHPERDLCFLWQRRAVFEERAELAERLAERRRSFSGTWRWRMATSLAEDCLVSSDHVMGVTLRE